MIILPSSSFRDFNPTDREFFTVCSLSRSFWAISLFLNPSILDIMTTLACVRGSLSRIDLTVERNSSYSSLSEDLSCKRLM